MDVAFADPVPAGALPSAVKVILIPGNGGSTPGDFWYPRVEEECAALGLAVVNTTFPDNVRARARFWLPFLEELGADEQTILIGHSSGYATPTSATAAKRRAATTTPHGNGSESASISDGSRSTSQSMTRTSQSAKLDSSRRS
jgi:pimeloyl-ACP methyl ester carboxylesterase